MLEIGYEIQKQSWGYISERSLYLQHVPLNILMGRDIIEDEERYKNKKFNTGGIIVPITLIVKVSILRAAKEKHVVSKEKIGGILHFIRSIF